MTPHRIAKVEVPRFPVLRVVFDDGLAGELNFADLIDSPPFGPLADEGLFRNVELAGNGRALGWNLDVSGQEIDYCADAARIEIETRQVEELAAAFASRRSAAE
jgi:hypothetical protein